MDERSEPTTGELIEFLRSEPLIAHRQCADRLEIQERELEQHKKWHNESIANATNNIVELERQVSVLTARAEKAEAREKAAIKDVRRHCATCLHGQQEDGRCAIGVNGKCYFGGYDYWTWRGLPQDGEGKI